MDQVKPRSVAERIGSILVVGASCVLLYLEWFVWIIVLPMGLGRGGLLLLAQASHFGLAGLASLLCFRMLKSWSPLDQLLGYLLVPVVMYLGFMMALLYYQNPFPHLP